MHQRMLSNKILIPLTRSVWLGHVNKFSNDVTKNVEEFSTDNSESSYNTQDVSHLLEQSTTYKDAKDKNWATTPYHKDVPVKETDDKEPSVDPESTSVLLFPGQGTIKVGTVKKYMHFPAAKELFDSANEILNYDLLKLCLNGPQEKLDRTEFNQAATVVSSLAALEKLREERPNALNNCVATAGYSVGEITSLILSGAITFEDGIRLVHVRGKAMQYAADQVPQGMLSVICAREAKVSKACTDAEKWAMEMGIENPICRVAIFLCTERKILAGNIEALQYIEKHRKELGFRNTSRLPVSGAFHTPLMNPSLKPVFKILTSIEIDEPRCKVYSNYKGRPYGTLQFMKKYILKQIVSPLKWEQCIQNIYNRPQNTSFPQTYDIASEGRMKTILKLINAKAHNSCIAI